MTPTPQTDQPSCPTCKRAFGYDVPLGHEKSDTTALDLSPNKGCGPGCAKGFHVLRAHERLISERTTDSGTTEPPK